MKKPRILVVPSDPTYGTDLYRATGPFSRLDIDIVKPDGKDFSWATLAGIDILFLQRPAVPTNIHQIEIAKKWNVPVLLDYDDDPFHLNPENPVYDIWNQEFVRASVREALKLADLVTVSTQTLKDVFLQEVPTANIRVVPNAVDDYMFSLEPFTGERSKTILLRGAGSHSKDWGDYKDGILQVLKDFPDYKLAIMGLHPEWVTEIPESQLRPFPFTDIPTYFDTLMEIRPELCIVPLSDNTFNRCKSAIGLYEGLIAGAVTMSSDLPEFGEYCSAWFHDSDHLVVMAHDILKNKDIWNFYYEAQLESVPRLSQVNEMRKDIIEELMTLTKKKAPRNPEKKQATDKEFHDYALSHGHTQDFSEYDKAHKHLSDWFVKTIKPKTALELGFGTGATLTHLLQAGVYAHGIEINPYSYQYFTDRYPMYLSQVSLGDITQEPITIDQPGDLVYSIEVFEHINKPDEWFEAFLTDLSFKFKNFYFTSTPYADTEYFEAFWGHCNVKKSSTWIKLFEKSGWKLVSNPKVMVNWDLWFSSKNLA
jgi:hypothetical protein